MKTIAWYITPHGYGHGARSTDLMRTVVDRRPDISLVVCTTLPESFLSGRLAGLNYTRRPVALDVGMVQADSVRVNLEETQQKLRGLLDTWDDQVAREGEWLKEAGIDGVVADIPGIALQAARDVGLPSVAIGNFGWDWIYEDFVGAAGESSVWNEAVDAPPWAGPPMPWIRPGSNISVRK